MIENLHISYGVDPEKCKNLEESYGEICVMCNKCGRWNDRNIDQEKKDIEEFAKTILKDYEKNN